MNGRLRAARLVTETAEGRGTWAEEVHDLCADFARLLPGKQDGRVLRVHVMTDSDGVSGRMAAAHAESRFANQCRSRASLAEGGAASPARGRP
jgi:hypothetical protein